jgi:hypothetical protein
MIGTLSGIARMFAAAAIVLSPLAAQAKSPLRPAHVRADAGPVARAFGTAMAGRILSDEFHRTRAWATITSARETPGHVCPKDRVVQLDGIKPFPVQPGAVSWIERWRIGCDVTVRRNLFALREAEKLRMLQLAPGGCDIPGAMIDIAMGRMPERPGPPWGEVWTVPHCDERQPVTVPFTPSARGGATWSIAASADRLPTPATQDCAAHRDGFAALIGKSEPEARAALANMGGIMTIRSGGPGMPMTRDYRADRATIMVERDMVTSITCG